MAKISKIAKSLKPQLATREPSRCMRCGRPRAYMRQFGLCRLCFRNFAVKGELPGVKKASW